MQPCILVLITHRSTPQCRLTASSQQGLLLLQLWGSYESVVAAYQCQKTESECQLFHSCIRIQSCSFLSCSHGADLNIYPKILSNHESNTSHNTHRWALTYQRYNKKRMCCHHKHESELSFVMVRDHPVLLPGRDSFHPRHKHDLLHTSVCWTQAEIQHASCASMCI